MSREIINSIYNLLPELLIALAVITLPLLRNNSKSRSYSDIYIVCCTLLASFILVWAEIYFPPKQMFDGLLIVDSFGSFAKLAVLLTTIIIIFAFCRKEADTNYQLILLMILGAFASVSSLNLVMTFASLEIISIGTFLLISANKKLAFRLFTYSAISSGLMLYGITLLYGLTNSLNYTDISIALSSEAVNRLTLTISLILTLSGLGFKSLLYPFNFIYPSLAEKLPLGQTALLSAIPVIAVIIVTARFLLTALHDAGAYIDDDHTYRLLYLVKWQDMIVILSTASIVAGNLIVLWQSDLKKMISFVIIAQAGNLLLAMAVPSPDSLSAVIVNIFMFCISTLGLFTTYHIISSKYSLGETISLNTLKEIGKKSPLLIISLLVFLLSSIGFLLTPAFGSRIFLLTQLFKGDYYWFGIAIILSLTGFIFFIFRLTILSFSGSTSIKSKLTEKSRPTETFHKILLLSLLFSTGLFGVYPTPLIELGRYCSKYLSI